MIYHGKDLGDYYLVSNNGEIKGVKTGKIRKKNINHEGYYYVCISLGSRKNKPYIKVHRAVAETFIHNEDDTLIVNHKDGNKLNNHVDNLEWCTLSENTIHAFQNSLCTKNKQIICLNTETVFNSISDACRWCGLHVSSNSMKLHLENKLLSAGKHPETKEPLQWMYYDEYLKTN